MNKIPIVFCFDDNLTLPAGVSISSLLENANEDTYYDIFILHDEMAKFPSSNFLDQLKDKYANYSITYRNVGNPFPKAFEIRGITIPAYYRLLIPKLIPEYDVIMYHDVDVIFRSDLSHVFMNTDLQGYYVAGVFSGTSYDKYMRDYMSSLGLDPVYYINSGNLIFNSVQLLADGIVDRFIAQVKNKYKYQDQDIINIVCKDRIKFLPPYYSGTVDLYKLASLGNNEHIFKDSELQDMIANGNVHYNGAKPWHEYCTNFDIWWEYYRKSVFFQPRFYYEFYVSKMNYLDSLSLYKRLKILFRYFIVGQNK